MNFHLTLEKNNEFGQRAKILENCENAHEIRKNNRFMFGRGSKNTDTDNLF